MIQIRIHKKIKVLTEQSSRERLIAMISELQAANAELKSEIHRLKKNKLRSCLALLDKISRAEKGDLTK